MRSIHSESLQFLEFAYNQTYLNALSKDFNIKSYEELLLLDDLLESIQIAIYDAADSSWSFAMEAAIEDPSQIWEPILIHWRNKDWVDAIGTQLNNKVNSIIYAQFGAMHLKPLIHDLLIRLPGLKVYPEI